jgi:hypothetical protein
VDDAVVDIVVIAAAAAAAAAVAVKNEQVLEYGEMIGIGINYEKTAVLVIAKGDVVAGHRYYVGVHDA